MAAIKSYTDVNQSKKLADILPLESADMFYDGVQDLYKEKVYNIPLNGSSITVRSGHIITQKDIKANLLLPCWTLASLLKLMPIIEANEPMLRKLYYISEPTERYICQYSLTDMTSEYDNPVDACVEMIIHLHELKML